MASTSRHQAIDCKTIDGTIISAWLYAVEGPAPIIIMSHGFNCVKEMTLPDIAEAFQSMGYNALLYDARSVGESGGLPKNLIDPLQMAEDLSGMCSKGSQMGHSQQGTIYICTHMAGLPSVDGSRIALWGMSFGGVVSACSAAVDRRPKAVVMVCPLFSYVQPRKAEAAYAMLIRDRVSQLRGNDAYSLAPFTPQGDNPIGMGGAGGPGGLAAYSLMKAAAELGTGHFRDRLTLQTYHKLAMFRPQEYMDMIRAPVMMVIPEKDEISPPPEQHELFARVQSPKRKYLAQGKGHLDVATGEGSAELMTATYAFLEDAFAEALE